MLPPFVLWKVVCTVCKVPLANIENHAMHKISIMGCSQETFLSFTIFPDVFYWAITSIIILKILSIGTRTQATVLQCLTSLGTNLWPSKALSYFQHFTEDAAFFMTALCSGVRLWHIFCAVFIEQEFVESHIWYYMLEKLHKSWNHFVNIWIQIHVSYMAPYYLHVTVTLSTLIFRYLGHHFMKPGDFKDISVSRILHVVQNVELLNV
jgi:hypothetical protein